MHSPVRRAAVGRSLLAGLFLAVAACEGPTELHHAWGPGPSLRATTRTLPDTGGALALAVDVVVRNDAREAVHLYVGSRCPLFVRVFPDSTGEQQGSLDATMACQAGGSVLLLAPGDSTILTRIIPADALTAYTPGRYGVNVAVTSAELLMGTWAGSVLLPLTASP